MTARPATRIVKPASSSPEETVLPVAAMDAAVPVVVPGAAVILQDIALCPYGTPVKLVDAAGHSAIGIRNHYQPHWFNASRSGPLGFEPVSWGSA